MNLIRDIFDGICRMGGRTTRTFSLSVYSPDDHGMPVYITGRGQSNEQAFKCLDLVLILAHEDDVRIILPQMGETGWSPVLAVKR